MIKLPREYHQPHLGVMASGISGNLSLWDFEDDFTSYATQGAADSAWSRIDTTNNYQRVNITNDNLDFDFRMDSTDDSIAYDLGVISDSAWLLRFKMNFTTLTSSTDNISYLGISSHDETTALSGNQDFIGWHIDFRTAGKNYGTIDADGSSVVAGADTTQLYTFLVSTDYYVQLKRTSTTAYSVEIFTGSDYATGSLGEATGTCTSTTDTLRYIKLGPRGTVTDGGTITGTIDDVFFIDGQSTPPV